MHISLGACSGRFPRFDLGGGTEHPAADTRLRLKHLKLDLHLDFELKRLSGRCSATIDATAPGISEAVFDAVAMDVSKVTSAGAALSFHQSEGKLHVALGAPAAPGSALTLEIEYATIPRFGFFFLAPDEAYPDRPRQAWSQGQDDYSRYWYPCLDAPNQKATSEVLADVPAPMEAISNGRLIEQQDLPGGRRRFHWRHETPHSPYLVSLVAGEFVAWHVDSGGVDFVCYVPRGREADGHRAFDQTPAMAEFFGEFTGQGYPYPKYAQVCVADFI
ncbi:MAG: M1 family metallopeptidase, partial [Solirubrobacterales bacterium]